LRVSQVEAHAHLGIDAHHRRHYRTGETGQRGPKANVAGPCGAY
jgi:hypothetical protein